MKKLIHLFGMLSILISCHDKKTEIHPLPNASFSVTIEGDNIAIFSFNANNNDIYTFDFGDGDIQTDVLKDIENNKPIEIKHIYRSNGDFTVRLLLRNEYGIDQKQKVIEAKSMSVADFSYEILENGKIKLKNLSQNTRYGHKWLIGEYAFAKKSGYYFYTSTEKEPVVDIDLNGKYQIRLEVPGQYTASMMEKTVYIKNALNQMTFSGTYNGESVNLSLDGLRFYYTNAVEGGGVSPFGLSQSLWENAESKIIYSKFYTFPNDNLMEPLSKEGKYSFIRQSLTRAKDADIIEVKEEYLDRDFYNNTYHFYPIAFWVRYKIKNKQLDGELKVRIMVSGLM